MKTSAESNASSDVAISNPGIIKQVKAVSDECVRSDEIRRGYCVAYHAGFEVDTIFLLCC